MKILFLSPHKDFADFIKSYGDMVLTITGSVTASDVNHGDFIVTYDYHETVPAEIVRKANGNAIGLKTAYLPWNRGADSNLWSFIDGTPKGVTVYFLDGGEDSGDIIAQRYLKFDYDADTLATFSDKLTACLEDLFKKTWHYIRDGKAKRYPQVTQHSENGKAPYEHVLTNGKDTLLKDIIKGLK